MTQVQLAQALAVANGTVAMWETEKREPDMTTILRIANYFGVSTDYLIGNDKQDGCSEKFKEHLSVEMELARNSLSEEELALAGYYELEKIMADQRALTLANACRAAEIVGCSVSHLLGDDGPDVPSESTKKSPGPDESEPRDEIEQEAIRLVRSLELPQKALALSILQTIAAESQRKPGADQASASEAVSKIERQGSPK